MLIGHSFPFIRRRKIGEMLKSREPKIVNGPEILDKYVGEAESKIRKLFEDAEKEEQEVCTLLQLPVLLTLYGDNKEYWLKSYG